MFYVAVDQHSKQLTVSVRDEAGDVVRRRQVSTEWERVRQFWADIRERSSTAGGFVVILEVCGFNDWLVAMVREYGCCEVVLVQADERSKTDRRDANRLGELLWVNRQRLQAWQRVPGFKRVQPPSITHAEARQLTAMRQRRGLGLTSITKPDPRGGGPVRGGTCFRWWLRPRSHERQVDENGPPLARGSQNRLRVLPPRGSRTRLASRNHEGMCREAAATAKQGRHQLARPQPDRPLCSTLTLANNRRPQPEQLADQCRQSRQQQSSHHRTTTVFLKPNPSARSMSAPRLNATENPNQEILRKLR